MSANNSPSSTGCFAHPQRGNGEVPVARMSGETYTIIGVMPADFRFGADTEAWVTIRKTEDWTDRSAVVTRMLTQSVYRILIRFAVILILFTSLIRVKDELA